MRQLTLLLFFSLFVCVSFAEIPESEIVVAPVVHQNQKKDQTSIGAFIAEPTAQPLNSLDIIRSELAKIQTNEQLQARKEGVLWHTTKRFTPESITFFIAIGAVTYNSMWIKSHGDPLAMERHILSLKDPIAHLSFFSFMIANGFYIDLKTKSMDPHTKAQMMRRLSYQGMAVGSLASSIVSDLGHSAQMCVNQWILGRNDESSIQSCNEAWKNWTVRNKFTQYFPQVISMWASQAGTELIDRGAKYGFQKVTALSSIKKILTKEWLVQQAYKVSGADIALSFTGGTWAIKGIKFVGKLTQFTLFVSVDHFLSQYTLRPLNTLIQPLFIDFDAATINKYWAAYDDGDWDEKKIIQPPARCIRPPFMPLVFLQKCFESSFEQEIENYGQHMQQWRDNLNSDVEADLAGWMEMTKKILNQFDYSYKFYREFTSTLFETLNLRYRVQTKQADLGIFNNKSTFPFRTLPLYGVSLGEIKTLGGSVQDLYLNRPFEIEKRQLEHIQNILKQVKSKPVLLSGASLEKYNEIIAKLDSANTNIIASGLNNINQLLSITKITDPKNSIHYYSKFDFEKVLTQLRKQLGEPMPVVYPFAGFAQAFAMNDPMVVTAKEADFSLWSIFQKYRFNKEPDLMLYKILCGNSFSNFDKTQLQGHDMLMPQFQPPSLLNKNSDRDEFCKEIRTTNNLYSTSISGKNLKDYVLANLNYSAIGDYRDSSKSDQFEKWWLIHGKAPVTKEFAIYDKKFNALVNLAKENIFDKKTGFKKYADYLNQSLYLKGSLQQQFKIEASFYLQLIQRALTKEVKKSVVSDLFGYRNYLLQAVKSSEASQWSGLNNVTYAEVQKIYSLMADYSKFILNASPDTFDQYIVHSKKIDTAINDVLVLASLKKVEIKGSTDFNNLLSSASSSGSETSENIYADLEVKNPSARQKIILAAVKGLRQVESENRRFIRMKIMLSQSLEVDTKEFMSDWNNTLKGQSINSKGASPRGL